MRKSLAFASVLALAVGGLAGSAGATPCGTIVGLNGDGNPHDIVADTTWGGAVNPSPICLEEPVFVQPGVTLTILPGTIVRGQPRRDAPGAVDGTPGAVVVTQGGKIDAEGAPDDPIIMTTAAVDNDADGVCDDGDGDGWFDPHPGFQDSPAGCITAGTCALAETAANATFCDFDPFGAPMPPLASDGSANLSQWGGVVILGRAPTNVALQSGAPGDVARTPNPGGTNDPGYGYFFVEGLQLPGFDPLDAQCGGVEPHDSSGNMSYVSVRHGGDEIGNGNELNGVSLCGVGDGTIFQYNEVYSNFDDSFEFFGGTVQPDHLVATYVGDDHLDIDLGYTGAIQFLFGMQPFFNQDSGANFGSASGDKAGEFDGDDYNADDVPLQSNVNVRVSYNATVFPGETNAAFALDSRDTTPWPLSGPYISNWTAIGSSPDGANPAVSPAAANTGVQFRHGFAGQVLNALVVNTSGPCLVIDTGSPESTTDHDLPDHAAHDLTRWISSSCDGSGPMAAAANDVADNGDAFATFDTGGLAGCSTAANELNIRSTGLFTGLVQEDPTFDPKAFGGAPYDPRPIGPGADCGVTPRVPGFDRSANYRGAFAPGAPVLWTTGWTTLNLAGQLAD